jgi:hypothetical protein
LKKKQKVPEKWLVSLTFVVIFKKNYLSAGVSEAKFLKFLKKSNNVLHMCNRIGIVTYVLLHCKKLQESAEKGKFSLVFHSLIANYLTSFVEKR